MTTPSGAIAYADITVVIYEDGHATLQAYGCIVMPDGTLQSVAGGWQFSVEIPLVYGATTADVQAAVGQAIATGYGGAAPDVVLLPSF